MDKLYFPDLQAHNVRFRVRTLARSFVPFSWLEHLTPSMEQYWAMLLMRTAYGHVDERLAVALGVHGHGYAGVGTWCRDANNVYYVWSGAGERYKYQLPEWTFGLWRWVTSAFHTNVSPIADYSDDDLAADMDDLADSLEGYAKGHRVFRALGILGGIWAPEGDL